MHKLAICDLDGTLVDSREDLADAINLTRTDFSLEPLSIPVVTGFVGNGARKLVERAFHGESADIEHALGLFKGHYGRNLKNKTQLYPTVKEGLETLRKSGCKLVVVSNKPAKNCISLLEHLKIDSFFELVYGGDSHALKPNPQSIMMAMEGTGSSREHSWIVGDGMADLEAGRNAGIRCCYAEYGFFSLDASLFDFSVKCFSDFANYLSGHK